MFIMVAIHKGIDSVLGTCVTVMNSIFLRWKKSSIFMGLKEKFFTQPKKNHTVVVDFVVAIFVL